MQLSLQAVSAGTLVITAWGGPGTPQLISAME